MNLKRVGLGSNYTPTISIKTQFYEMLISALIYYKNLGEETYDASGVFGILPY